MLRLRTQRLTGWASRCVHKLPLTITGNLAVGHARHNAAAPKTMGCIVSSCLQNIAILHTNAVSEFFEAILCNEVTLERDDVLPVSVIMVCGKDGGRHP